MSTDTPSTDTADISSAASLATLVHRRQNLQILATFAALGPNLRKRNIYTEFFALSTD